MKQTHNNTANSLMIGLTFIVLTGIIVSLSVELKKVYDDNDSLIILNNIKTSDILKLSEIASSGSRFYVLNGNFGVELTQSRFICESFNQSANITVNIQPRIRVYDIIEEE